MKFVDEVTITVSSGKGGPGAVSFRRESKVPRGGPDGGDGGRGGHVIFCADSQLGSLLDLRFKKRYVAKNGNQGGASQSSGADGVDLKLPVPPGTVIRGEQGEIIADMAAGEEFTFLKGGRGGKGNHFFKTSVNQAPEHAQTGEEGQEATIHLELKLLADIGIIGYPNAGKSTLISRVSAARPKIDSYPFTTLIPNLGVVRYGEDKSFVVADIPGLITDAHKGVGLGTQFLKHIERTRAFVHVIDVSEMAMQEPMQSYKDINRELLKYDENHHGEEGYVPLRERPQLVVLNKIDSVNNEKLQEIVDDFLRDGVKVFNISAATGQNVRELTFAMGDLVFKREQETDG